MYRAVIFDVDGTLINTEKSILLSLQKTLKELLNKVYQESELEFSLGIPGEYTIRKLQFPDPAEAFETWSGYIDENRHLNSLFDGVKTLLKELQKTDMVTGIVTSRTRTECDSDPLLQSLLCYVDHCICADDTVKHKPFGEPLLQFMKDTSIQPKDAIYIGDTIYDRQCAENAGVDFILAGWGTREDLNQENMVTLMHPYEIMERLYCHPQNSKAI